MEHGKRMKKGFEVLRKMGRLGTMTNQKALYPELYDLSVGYLFGEIWTRPHLSLRDRELITLASNIALARPHGTHSHYRSARHLGFTKERSWRSSSTSGITQGGRRLLMRSYNTRKC